MIPTTRGDSPLWQVPPIPESAQQQALLYLVQCRLRAAAIHAELQRKRRTKKAATLAQSEPEHANECNSRIYPNIMLG